MIGDRDLAIPIDLKLVAAFDKIAQPLFLRAEGNRIECRVLIATRNALLPKLISGDLAIADAERIAARCV